jgi:hypothetical protein
MLVVVDYLWLDECTVITSMSIVKHQGPLQIYTQAFEITMQLLFAMVSQG